MNVAITGGGISGLTAAISLRRAGHRVTIYEKSSLNNEVGAAIHVPPNVTRFLGSDGWNLDPSRARFISSEGIYFMNLATLEERLFHDHSRTMEVYSAPLYYAHRVDLHNGLKHIAMGQDGLGAPVKLITGSEVVGYDLENPGKPAMRLADGTIVAPDLIVAADGVHSIAVEAVLGQPNPPLPPKHANCCYRFLIPRSVLEEDAETRFFLPKRYHSTARSYADPDGKRRLVAYQCRDHEIVNFVVICSDDDLRLSKKEDWHAAVDKSELLSRFSDCRPGILAVINKATDVKRWPLLYRQPIPTWHKGNMILIGDAAHPMLPRLSNSDHAQGGAQGIEDGLALGLTMVGVADPAQVPERLSMFEKIRRNRASSIQILSNHGYDEKPAQEMAEFMEGEALPATPAEMINLEYRYDVAERTIRMMSQLDPKFRMPDGFLGRGWWVSS